MKPNKSSKELCPYKKMPKSKFWRNAVYETDKGLIDPVTEVGFNISLEDKVATAGSCFAQHIARYLSNSGYNYYVSEKGPKAFPLEVRKKFNYGVFSARFGNIYTVRQLVQLLKRAFGQLELSENCWEEDGRFYDPYRPFIEQDGFSSKKELLADLKEHLKCVKQMFEELDVFVFTLGLTEAWISKKDGAVFPVCPGCGVGEFFEDKYEFHNFSIDETTSDLQEAIDFIRLINPASKVILTVSPVPLVATATENHPLVATTYSKSVLRVAAQTIKDRNDLVDYFPSYEIITGNFNRGAYYSADLRSVREEGVKHVMNCFLKHYTNGSAEVAIDTSIQKIKGNINEELAEVICDEEMMEKSVLND
jgi:hypothetical protein